MFLVTIMEQPEVFLDTRSQLDTHSDKTGFNNRQL